MNVKQYYINRQYCIEYFKSNGYSDRNSKSATRLALLLYDGNIAQTCAHVNKKLVAMK